MTPENGQYPPDLIRLLACGASYRSAARSCGISEKTVRRRMAEGSFREEVKRFRDEAFANGIGTLQALSTEAVRTLRKLMKTGSEKAKLGAAQTILNYGLRSRELLDIEERLKALEGAKRARN